MPFSDERLALARERALSLAASRTAAAGATSPGGTSPVLLAVATGLPEAEVEPPEFPTLEAEDAPKQVRLAEGSLVLLVNDMKSRLGGHEGRTIMAVTLAGDGSSDSECRVDRVHGRGHDSECALEFDGLPRLQTPWLACDEVGVSALTKLADAIYNGSMPSLRAVYVSQTGYLHLKAACKRRKLPLRYLKDDTAHRPRSPGRGSPPPTRPNTGRRTRSEN